MGIGNELVLGRWVVSVVSVMVEDFGYKNVMMGLKFHWVIRVTLYELNSNHLLPRVRIIRENKVDTPIFHLSNWIFYCKSLYSMSSYISSRFLYPKKTSHEKVLTNFSITPFLSQFQM